MGNITSAKIGDTLLIRERYGDKLEIVNRLTNTRVYVGKKGGTGMDSEFSYHKLCGRIVGQGGYSWSTATLATNEDITRVTDNNIRMRNLRTLKEFDWSNLTNDHIKITIAQLDQWCRLYDKEAKS